MRDDLYEDLLILTDGGGEEPPPPPPIHCMILIK